MVVAAVVAVAVAAAGVAAAASLEPTRVLLGLVLAAVAVVCLVRIDAAILLLVASLPLESTLSISANPQLTVVKVAGALCLLSWVVSVAVRGRRLTFDASHAVILLLLALALVSTLEAASLQDALVRTLRYASFASLYLVVSQQVGDHVLQRRIVWVLSLAASASAVVGLHNFLTGVTTLARPVDADPNDFAYVLAATLPLTLWLLGERGLLRRLLVVAMAGVLGAGILLAYSRGALVGLGAGLLWQLVGERRHVRVVLLAALLGGGLTLGLFLSNQDRLLNALTAKGVVAERNISERLDAWDAAVRLAVQHPLLGVGPGNYQFASDRVLDRPPSDVNPTVVHDAYLDVAAELGITGLLLFVGYLLLTFSRLSVSVRTGRGPPGLASAVRTAMVVAMAATITLSEQYYAPLWLLGALGACFWHERRHGLTVR